MERLRVLVNTRHQRTTPRKIYPKISRQKHSRNAEASSTKPQSRTKSRTEVVRPTWCLKESSYGFGTQMERTRGHKLSVL
ncbi:hypothetical protein NDU88_007537 [Pleurodeles waltl]|uniref:Uncharacterized protein n=1 Tax=Pleurodeles waltl TaxID=8319 RepID=A0AAV7LTK7_PLEWA|nr:hypothetical protein NDU88_007537 [Pleurodeles waltl]